MLMKREQNKKTRTDDNKTFPSLFRYKSISKVKKIKKNQSW